MINEFFVSITKDLAGDLYGRLSHEALRIPVGFEGSLDMIRKVEYVLSLTGFPKSATEDRRFQSDLKIQENMAVGMEEKNVYAEKTDKKHATFVVKINYRQNATWQGEVFWVEKNEKKQFRSALELIKMIDGAAEESGI